jgi:hypothetical protein
MARLMSRGSGVNAPRSARESGQVLAIFALMIMGILFMGALLFDAAHAMVYRRVLQNAADAGAISGSNLIQTGTRGCNGGNGSTPRSNILSAALSGVGENLSGNNAASIAVSCPTTYNDAAVRVTVNGTSPSFFAPALRLVMSAADASAWTSGIPVSATATSINGGAMSGRFSVVELNPYNPSWHQSRNGCPSVLFSGGPTVIFEGNMQVNSQCPASSGGSMSTNGNAATLQFTGNAYAALSGGFAPGPLVVTPAPLVNQAQLKDPLLGLPDMPYLSLPEMSPSRLTLNNQQMVLEPGRYIGGIRLLNSSQAFLKPGIYVLDGGGIDVGAQASVFSITAGGTASTTVESWNQDCPLRSCGVLIFNRGTSSSMGPISIGAGAKVLLRPYNPDIDPHLRMTEYENLLIWQDRNPVPNNTSQPQISLGGGGKLDMTGTLYAPSAKVYMTGGSGGGGGDVVDLTLQFITWDMQIQGNSTFHFRYSGATFARPLIYGLVE